MVNNKGLKYLWIFSAADEWTVAWHERNRQYRLAQGYNITYFCNTPKSLQRRWLPFPELDRLWKSGYPPLLKMYEDLSRIIEKHDVLILYNGANLHPDFISHFKNILKVYTFGDPECSEELAKPISPFFDIHLVNQISEIEKFRKWGFQNVFFWPLGSLTFIDDVTDINESSILNIKQRPISTAIYCEFNNWRSTRLTELRSAFPNSIFGGRGWEEGFIPWDQMWATYRKTQIGWNVHNTTGFNFRTYDLLSMGVMQICDNKSDITKILTDGKEVIGFETIKECIELTNFYLAHPNEQREIALAGWKRWKQDYSPDKIWEKLVAIVEENYNQTDFADIDDKNIITLELRKKRSFFYICAFLSATKIFLKKLTKKLLKIIKLINNYGK